MCLIYNTYLSGSDMFYKQYTLEVISRNIFDKFLFTRTTSEFTTVKYFISTAQHAHLCVIASGHYVPVLSGCLGTSPSQT